jgi:hypothetical protein
MRVALIKDGIELGSVEIPAKEASRIAGIILGAASEAHRVSGRPNPNDKEADITVVIPSGSNVGPGRRLDKVIAMFYFGETTLGIGVPNENARTLGATSDDVCCGGDGSITVPSAVGSSMVVLNGH